MMLMSDRDDAYVDAMLMVNMQANTRSVTSFGQGTLILAKSPRASFARGFHCFQLAFAGSLSWGEERDVPSMGRQSSSLVTFYRVVQVRTHVPFNGGWL